MEETLRITEILTIRDYFAAKALNGWMSNPLFINNKLEYEYAVQASYKIADEMIKQREK